MTKTASGISVFLLEELGDARLRCAQLKKYIADATHLIEKSPQRDHFFEVAAHLIHGIPDTLFRMEKALDTAALAAARLDYEEVKETLPPEKIDQLERVMEDVRVRHVQRRSDDIQDSPTQEEQESNMATKLSTIVVAAMLDEIADKTAATGSVPLSDVATLIGLLEHGGQSKTASAPTERIVAHFRELADQIHKDAADGKAPSRVKLAGHLRNVYAAEMDPTMAQTAATIYHQASSREDVMKGFAKANPNMSEEALEKAADMWEKHQNTIKDKHKSATAVPDVRVDRLLGHIADVTKAMQSQLSRIGGFANAQTKGHVDTLQGQLRDVSSCVRVLDRAFMQGKTSSDQVADGPEPTNETAPNDVAVGDALFTMFDQARKANQAFNLGNTKKLFYYVQGVLMSIATVGRAYGVAEVDRMWKVVHLPFRALSGTSPNMMTASDMQDPVADQSLLSRFEQGKPADPTENMSPEDADQWKVEHDKHKDNFKAAGFNDRNRDASRLPPLLNEAAETLFNARVTLRRAYEPLHDLWEDGMGISGMTDAYHDTDVRKGYDMAYALDHSIGEAARQLEWVAKKIKKNLKQASGVQEPHATTADQAFMARFEKGKPADPTEHMVPEDADKWKVEHDNNKDNFKAAADPWKAHA